MPLPSPKKKRKIDDALLLHDSSPSPSPSPQKECQGQTANSQNTFGALHNSFNTPSGHALIPNMYTNATRQMQGQQMQQQQQQQNQLQNSVVYSQFREILNPNTSHQMQKQNVLHQMQQRRQPILDSPQQNVMQMTPSFQSNRSSSGQGYFLSLGSQHKSAGGQKQLTGQQSNILNTQQNQFFRQQHLNPQNFSVHRQQQYQNQMFESHINQQSMNIMQQNKSGVHQQLQVATWQSSLPMLKSQTQHSQHQSHVQSQNSQLWQKLVTQQEQSGSLQRGMQQQRDHCKASSSMVMDCTGRTSDANLAQLQEEIYQELMLMKEKYYLKLTEIYPRLVLKLHQLEAQKQLELVQRYKDVKTNLEKCIKFLEISKDTIKPSFKACFPTLEKIIQHIIDMPRNKRPGSSPSKQLSQHAQSAQPQQPLSNIYQKTFLQGSSAPESDLLNLKYSMPSNLDQTQNSSFSFLQPNMDVPGEQNLKLKQHRNHHTQFKTGNSFSVTSPQNLQTPFYQTNKTSFLQIDQQYAMTPIQNVCSSSVVPSPLTPTVRAPVNSAKSQSQFPAVGTLEVSSSPLVEEFMISEQRQADRNKEPEGLNANERPLAKLIKVVESLSPALLMSCVNDIGSVVSMTDIMANPVPGDNSIAALGDDLSTAARSELQGQNFIPQDENFVKEMILEMTSIPFSALPPAGSVDNNYKPYCGLGTYELNSTATSATRDNLMDNLSLDEEIRDINQKLINTVIQIDGTCDGLTAFAWSDDMIVVKCTFTPVSFSKDLISHLESCPSLQIMPLRLLVPANYPISSPTYPETLPEKLDEETVDLSIKTLYMFSRSLRTLSHPMSLTEMVKNWDFCAREVITEYATQFGGGSFSSVYGKWKQCSENVIYTSNGMGILL